MGKKKKFIKLDIAHPIWRYFFTISPLVVVGTKEKKGYDLAPKHLAMPIGFDNYFGFVCTPKHNTYHNILEHRFFSVSFPIPDQVLLTSLTAIPREKNISKFQQIISKIPTVKATTMDTLLLVDSYLHLECSLFKVIDGFGNNSLITGKIKAAAIHPHYIRVSEKDEQQQIKNHPLLAYLADGRFANISETFNFPFPKDFLR